MLVVNSHMSVVWLHFSSWSFQAHWWKRKSIWETSFLSLYHVSYSPLIVLIVIVWKDWWTWKYWHTSSSASILLLIIHTFLYTWYETWWSFRWQKNGLMLKNIIFIPYHDCITYSFVLDVFEVYYVFCFFKCIDRKFSVRDNFFLYF